MYAKAQPRLDRCIIRRDVARPIDIAFFHPQAFNRTVADITDAVTYARLPEPVIDMGGKFGGDVQFIAQLPDITDPRRPYRGRPDDNLAGC